MKYIKFGIVFSIIFLIASFFSIKSTYAQTADGACSARATALEQNCTFQNGISRLNGKCQVKDKNNLGLGLTCRRSLGSSCSGDTCQNGLACINQVCSSPRGNKTEGQSCSGNGNECVAGLKCSNFKCIKENAIIGGTTNSPSGSNAGGGGNQVGTSGGATGSNTPGVVNTGGGTTNGSSTNSETGLVKCGTSRDCTICDIFILIRDIFNLALGLLASLAVLSIVIGGVYILTSAGNPGGVSTGYGIITNAVIGLLLVMSSFLLFSFLLVGLGFQEQNFSAVLTFQSGKIFEVKCDTASTFNDNGSNGGGAATTGGGSGNVGSLSVACVDATNLDDNISAVMRTISFYEGASDRSGYFRLVGGKMYPQSQNIHPGAENPNLYQTTRLNSDAYGRFQMLSTTWAPWAAIAGVPTVKPGTYTIKEGTFAYYNMAPQYQDAAVAATLKKNGITDCQSFRNSSYRCQWASIVGCEQQNDKTRAYPFAETCAKMLADEKTGACKQ
jgi:muramidase (phage lysozyme)